MCGGEIEQLKKRFQFNLTEAEYFSFIQKKTASLFGASARCGAVLSAQPLSIQLALDSFGNNLGIAFQITDDLLDLTGEEAVVGKTLRTDLTNGKMTLPLIHYRDHLQKSAVKDAFLETLKHPNGDIPALVENITAAGSIRYAEEVAQKHMNAALSDLEKLPKGPARDHFTSLVDMLLHRDS
jgi:heptaprenyl diphosphate synthase